MEKHADSELVHCADLSVDPGGSQEEQTEVTTRGEIQRFKDT